MSMATETTILLSDEYSEYSHQPQAYSSCIDNLEKPLNKGYAPILAEDELTAGLTLQELSRFIDDPFWQKLRRTLFCTSWLVFSLILITACTLAYMQLDIKCSTRTNPVTQIATTTTTITAAAILQRI